LHHPLNGLLIPRKKQWENNYSGFNTRLLGKQKPGLKSQGEKQFCSLRDRVGEGHIISILVMIMVEEIT
jgi:hypothetical protein